MHTNHNTVKFLTKEKPIITNTPNSKFESVLFLPKNKDRQAEGGLRTQNYFKKSHPNTPLISVITVTFNGEKYLEQTIQSIINQTYENMEYIIIDGGSTDGTVEIIKKYENKIDYWVSEKDAGIGDAFNKGIILALGDYINFQGDGDGFYSADSLGKVFNDIDWNKYIFISAKIQKTDENNKELYVSKHVKTFKKISLLFRMSMPHQGLFTHKNYFKQYGLFDINNTFCMDYEHLLRAYHNFPETLTINVIVARWRADGIGIGRNLEIFKEYSKIKRDNKVANKVVLNIIKHWILLKFYIKEALSMPIF